MTLSVIISSLASVGAISTMYDGTEMSYDNSSTHMAATDVQGANSTVIKANPRGSQMASGSYEWIRGQIVYLCEDI